MEERLKIKENIKENIKDNFIKINCFCSGADLSEVAVDGGGYLKVGSRCGCGDQ